MNGQRGAKGSVNDRIISYLYRKRYLEYLKKKESYTAEERQKAIDYLKKIKEFDIDNNVSVLDDEDKSILGEVYNNLEIDDFFESPEKDFLLNPDIQKVKGYDSVSSISDFPIDGSFDNINDLIEKSDKISTFDPFLEEYDFDKYDYYELVGNHKGLKDLDSNDLIEVDNEVKKVEDEKVIIEEVNEFIDDSVELLEDIKTDLNGLKQSIDELHTEQDIKKINEKYYAVKEKLDKLKKQYDVMKEKYEFEDYDILDNIKLIESIDDYKDRASLEELELMVDACKYEIEAIDGVVIEQEKRVGIGENIEKKHKVIKERDKDFSNKKNKVHGISDDKNLIADEIKKQQEIIRQLDEKLAQVTTTTETVREYIYNTNLMFRSFLRIAAGILTAPFSGLNILRTRLGVNLINHGLRDLRSSLIPNEVVRVQVRERYTDIEREILNTKDDVEKTIEMIDTSIEQIDKLKKYFNTNFESEASYIPEYNDVKKMMDELDKTLQMKKEEIQIIDKKLDEQYESNKQKVLRAEKVHYRNE